MRVLQVTTVLAVLAFSVHAAFTQWYETGTSRYIAPLLAMAFAAGLVAFLLRKPWSWRVAGAIAATTVGLNLLFWPEAKHFGKNLSFAQYLIGVEVALSAIIGICMLMPSTKRWFNGKDAA
jgi:hypothetical protein